LKTTAINGTQVLTNFTGFTVYWFAPDTSTTSKCTSSWATYWPPARGPGVRGFRRDRHAGHHHQAGRHHPGHR
jgi:predicted lipoprotein with Yx(FWY)xxD motif